MNINFWGIKLSRCIKFNKNKSCEDISRWGDSMISREYLREQ